MKRVLLAGVLAAAALARAAFGADTGASYGETLAQVYRTYEEMTGRKDACTEAFPGARAAVEHGYSAWRDRNAQTITELDERLTRMIRGASRDAKDYARNIGKYEGALVQQRLETKRALLAQPRDGLELLCKSLPELLTSKESDLETLYADELKSIRSRR